jgi:hypothetical protein
MQACVSIMSSTVSSLIMAHATMVLSRPIVVIGSKQSEKNEEGASQLFVVMFLLFVLSLPREDEHRQARTIVRAASWDIGVMHHCIGHRNGCILLRSSRIRHQNEGASHGREKVRNRPS